MGGWQLTCQLAIWLDASKVSASLNRTEQQSLDVSFEMRVADNGAQTETTTAALKPFSSASFHIRVHSESSPSPTPTPTPTTIVASVSELAAGGRVELASPCSLLAVAQLERSTAAAAAHVTASNRSRLFVVERSSAGKHTLRSVAPVAAGVYLVDCLVQPVLTYDNEHLAHFERLELVVVDGVQPANMQHNARQLIDTFANHTALSIWLLAEGVASSQHTASKSSAATATQSSMDVMASLTRHLNSLISVNAWSLLGSESASGGAKSDAMLHRLVVLCLVIGGVLATTILCCVTLLVRKRCSTRRLLRAKHNNNDDDDDDDKKTLDSKQHQLSVQDEKNKQQQQWAMYDDMADNGGFGLIVAAPVESVAIIVDQDHSDAKVSRYLNALGGVYNHQQQQHQHLQHIKPSTFKTTTTPTATATTTAGDDLGIGSSSSPSSTSSSDASSNKRLISSHHQHQQNQYQYHKHSAANNNSNNKSPVLCAMSTASSTCVSSDEGYAPGTCDVSASSHAVAATRSQQQQQQQHAYCVNHLSRFERIYNQSSGKCDDHIIDIDVVAPTAAAAAAADDTHDDMLHAQAIFQHQHQVINAISGSYV